MGCIRVPAMRLAMQSSSVGLVKTLTSAAPEKSGRLTCMPLRRRPASLIVDGDGGHLLEQGSGMGKAALYFVGWAGERFEFVEGDGLSEGEDAGLGAAEAGEVRAASCKLAELMCDGADIAAGGDLHLEACFHFGGRGAVEGEKLEAVDEDAGGFDFDGLAGTGELVGGDAGDFLGGEDGGSLQHFAVEGSGESAEFGEGSRQGLRIGGGRAFRVKGVGGKAEADRAFVAFFRGREELREAGVLAEQKREDAGGHGVERAEVADGALAGDAANDVDDVVRGRPAGLSSTSNPFTTAPSLCLLSAPWRLYACVMPNPSEPSRRTDPELAEVLAELMDREPIFHRAELGTTRADFERMTVADFWEVGASGQRFSREFVLDELERRFAEPHADVWETSDFRCQRLAEDVYLLTYTLLQDGVRLTRRSTIWEWTGEGGRSCSIRGRLCSELDVRGQIRRAGRGRGIRCGSGVGF